MSNPNSPNGSRSSKTAALITAMQALEGAGFEKWVVGDDYSALLTVGNIVWVDPESGLAFAPLYQFQNINATRVPE